MNISSLSTPRRPLQGSSASDPLSTASAEARRWMRTQQGSLAPEVEQVIIRLIARGAGEKDTQAVGDVSFFFFSFFFFFTQLHGNGFFFFFSFFPCFSFFPDFFLLLVTYSYGFVACHLIFLRGVGDGHDSIYCLEKEVC